MPWAFDFDAESDRVRSGAGCVTIGSSPQLVGYHVEGDPDGTTFDVTRSTIKLSDGGRRAAAGRTVTLGRSLPEDSAIVRTALGVSCGSDPGVEGS